MMMMMMNYKHDIWNETDDADHDEQHLHDDINSAIHDQNKLAATDDDKEETMMIIMMLMMLLMLVVVVVVRGAEMMRDDETWWYNHATTKGIVIEYILMNLDDNDYDFTKHDRTCAPAACRPSQPSG